MNSFYFTFDHKYEGVDIVVEAEVTSFANLNPSHMEDPAGWCEITDHVVYDKNGMELDVIITDQVIWDNFYIYLETQQTEVE